MKNSFDSGEVAFERQQWSFQRRQGRVWNTLWDLKGSMLMDSLSHVEEMFCFEWEFKKMMLRWRWDCSLVGGNQKSWDKRCGS